MSSDRRYVMREHLQTRQPPRMRERVCVCVCGDDQTGGMGESRRENIPSARDIRRAHARTWTGCTTEKEARAEEWWSLWQTVRCPALRMTTVGEHKTSHALLLRLRGSFVPSRTTKGRVSTHKPNAHEESATMLLIGIVIIIAIGMS